MGDKYINPFTDFGFKKIFGEEANKDLLIDFLNELLKNKGVITELHYLKNEQLGVGATDRSAVYDLYCKNDKGERFIVALQKAKQKSFKDRSLYYSTFAIQEQAQKGEWDYKLQGVYTIAIMDFTFDEYSKDFRHDVQLMNTKTKEIFYDKLHFIYLEMPKFDKNIEQLETHYDKWLFLLKNLSKLEDTPTKFKDKIFEKLFQVAEIAKYNDKERLAYRDSLKYYWDLKNVIDTAIEERIKEMKLELAKQMKQNQEPLAKIIQYTGLSEEQILNL